MAAFSVPFSSLCVSTMTSMVLAPPVAPADAVLAVPPQVADQGLELPVPPTFLSGFQVEGSPEVEVVFGDSESYRRHIDRFTALDKAMDAARSSFSRNVQDAVTTLGHHRAGCPVDRVARHYYEARRDGETYRALGAELESEQSLIRQLDRLGETAALTPDYRWKVNQVAGRYREALVDLKEMRLAFVSQLGSELRHRGCVTAALLRRGAALVATQAVAEADEPADQPDGAGPKPKPRPGEEPEQPVVPATTITFYVDNRACPAGQEVYLDGQLLGEVAGDARAAFQALAGRHSLCLIADASPVRCGDPGTIRAAFLHDGWSIGLHCGRN
ncbi:MAG TPA: hypothetical protein VK698_15155 [Kofleriaceae bacterium]|nr:hypothetical protein [Kofleriaceae bacterium]